MLAPRDLWDNSHPPLRGIVYLFVTVLNETIPGAQISPKEVEQILEDTRMLTIWVSLDFHCEGSNGDHEPAIIHPACSLPLENGGLPSCHFWDRFRFVLKREVRA